MRIRRSESGSKTEYDDDGDGDGGVMNRLREGERLRSTPDLVANRRVTRVLCF